MGEHATASPEPELVAGSLVAGKLRIERTLGAGGAGIVFEATHLVLRQKVAIKVLRGAAPLDATARFMREAQATAAIRSEHCVRTLDFGTLPSGAPYIVMEHLAGTDLATYVRRKGALDVERAADWILQACEAIAEAHARGIVHRDLKPANLFLTKRPDGSHLVKVLDFGIAKLERVDGVPGLTGEDTAIGTAVYMAPEQLRDASGVDARADVWALGVTLQELLTGKRPFDAKTTTGTMAAIVGDAPTALGEVLPGAPEQLERVILKCLSKDPTRRYANAGELAEALAPFGTAVGKTSAERARVVAHGVVDHASMPPPSVATKTLTERSPPRRSWLLLAVAAASTLALGVALGSLRASRATPAPTEAPRATLSGPVVVAPPSPSAPGATSAASSAPPPSSAAPSAKPRAPLPPKPGIVQDPSLLNRE